MKMRNKKYLIIINMIILLPFAVPIYGQTHIITLDASGSPKTAKKPVQKKNNENPSKRSSQASIVEQKPISLTASQMNDLGDDYCYGRNGKTQDYAEAVKWYRKSADQGDASGQSNLGRMYEKGYGVSQDFDEAVNWYRKSTDQGNASGQANLGRMYEKGYGVSQDYGEAVNWYRKSADQGNASAQFNLGVMYKKGYGVTKDYSESVKWLSKAADQGNADAQAWLSDFYLEGTGGVSKDYEKAVDLIRKSVDQGNSYGFSNLGYVYYKGYGVAQDYDEAFKWFLKSAEMDNEWGVSWIAFMYENGYGVTKDYTKAFKWYLKLAEQGDAYSQNIVGLMYRNGRGVTKDEVEAVKWYRKAAEQENKIAQYNLGFVYQNGYGVSQSYPEAEKWFMKSAFNGMEEAGYSSAQYELGKMYYTGVGYGSNSVAKNEKKGEELLREAAAQGHSEAKTFIEEHIGFDVKFYVYCMERGKREPVIGVSISLVNSKGKNINRQGIQTSRISHGAVTDINGNCTMTLKKGDRVKLSFIGFKSSYVTIGDNARTQTISCRLYED